LKRSKIMRVAAGRPLTFRMEYTCGAQERNDRGGNYDERIQVQKSGGPEFTFVDLPDPSQANEAVVKVSAAGVNFIDVLFSRSMYPSSLPFVIGQEASGIVSEIGVDVKSFKPGDRVAYTGIRGSYAEYAACRGPARSSAARNSETTSRRGDAAGMTALSGARHLSAEEGRRRWFHAARGRGASSVQMAKNIGARVMPRSAPRKKQCSRARPARTK